MKALLTIAPFVAVLVVFVVTFPRIKRAQTDGRQRDALLWGAVFLVGLALIVGTLVVISRLM